jgi:spore coat protein H
MTLHREPVGLRFRALGLGTVLGLVAMAGAAETNPPAAPAGKAPAVTGAAAPATGRSRGSGSEVFADPAKLHEVTVTIPRPEWNTLLAETYVIRGSGGGIDSLEDDITRADGRIVHIGGGFGGHFPWVHADLEVAGRTAKDVGFRYKGNGSYSQTAGMHRSIKLKTDLFAGKGDWDGLETINLNSGGRDDSRTREALAFAIFRLAGVPASRTAYAEVRYNVPGLHDQAYGGLFTVIENVNKAFLRQALAPGTGLLMKPERMDGGVGYYGETWANYTPYYRPEREATPAEAKRVIEFARLVNQGTTEEFRSRIEAYLDVDEFMRFLAVHALIQARDSYLSGQHNFFIYLDPRDNRFRFIPWDEDGALSNGTAGGGRGGFGGGTGPLGTDLMAPWSRTNPLAYWLLDDPKLAARYQAIVRDIVAKVFNREALLPLVDRLEALVDAPLTREFAAMNARNEFDRPVGTTPRFFLEDRFPQVQAQMAAWPKVP